MVMAVGGTLGIASIGVPFVETGIALSVAVLGAMVAFNVIAPTATAIGFVGLFAIFHGHAHGAEIPEDAGSLAYAAGWPCHRNGGRVTAMASLSRVMAPLSYRRHRFPAEIIRHAIWLYLRFTLSYRDVEELLAERGLDVSYETVRRWVLKLGPLIARK